jgi:hypothetical protein
MTSMLFAPTGTLKRRPKSYWDVLADLRMTIRIASKRKRKSIRHQEFLQTGDLIPIGEISG